MKMSPIVVHSVTVAVMVEFTDFQMANFILNANPTLNLNYYSNPPSP